jgi:hypothetical protein
VEGLQVHRVEQLLCSWKGNGGRRSLYSLCKELNIDINLAYVLLSSPRGAVLSKIKAGKSFHYYKPGMGNKFIPKKT